MEVPTAAVAGSYPMAAHSSSEHTSRVTYASRVKPLQCTGAHVCVSLNPHCTYNLHGSAFNRSTATGRNFEDLEGWISSCLYLQPRRAQTNQSASRSSSQALS